MIKPIGSACNMRCRYCYYLPVHVSGTGKMSLTTLETLIRNAISSSEGPTVSFIWHGGEPTLAGLDFFRAACELENKYLPDGWECWNNLQTNGLALDDDWCRFLSDNHFDVGLSIDGTELNHDYYRSDVEGRPTYARVKGSVLRLKEHNLRPDLLCTVTSHAAEDPIGVYSALRDLGTGWIQFIPVINRDAGGNMLPESVTPEQYGNFLCSVFNRWIYHDLGKVNVQFFTEMLNILSGGSPSVCWLQETCGAVPVAEADGAIYSCDHFVRASYRIGSVQEPISDILSGEFQESFGASKKAGLTGECLACPYLRLCNGQCPKDRFAVNSSGESGHYYLCEGLKQFFRVALGPMEELVRLNSQGLRAPEIMASLLAEEHEIWKNISRNDPCPCGSGKKAKKCCMPRRP